MDAFNPAIEQFGRTLGLEQLALQDGVLALQVDGTLELLFCQESAECLWISVSQQLPFYSLALLQQSLLCTHPSQRLPFVVNAGWIEPNELFFYLCLRADQSTPQQLDKAVNLLLGLHAQITP